jgi:hypothetical protein
MSSKSKEKAEATRESLTGSGGDSGEVGKSVKPCDKKHWITIVVKDSDDHPVTDVKPQVEVDGSKTSVSLNKQGKWESKKVLSSGADAVVSFPDLVNCDWWPEGSGEPAPVGEKDLPAVAEGDCAERLAATAGYRSYKNIWDAAANGAAKTNRPIANSLLKTDVFKGPEKKDKTEKKAVDQEWTFIVRAIKKPKLRLVFVDKELKPWKDIEWKLSGISKDSGKTGADGLGEALDIDPKKISGTLTIQLPPPEKQPPKTVVAATVPDIHPYPMAINEKQFEEKPPSVTKLATKLEIELHIGSLPPAKDKTGTIARLNNLGFQTGMDGDDDEIKRGVKAYQKDILKQDQPTGAFADIQDDVETRHTPA